MVVEIVSVCLLV